MTVERIQAHDYQEFLAKCQAIVRWYVHLP